MSFMTWTADGFGTNVSATDAEHQELFALVNQLHDSVPAGDRAATGKKLDDLIAYVAKHFQTEENLMQAHGYPGYAAHKEDHDKLVSTCVDLQSKFHGGQAEVTAEVTGFVKDWLCTHIPQVDKSYGPYLNGKGVA